jgi:hypothetical protein
MRMNDVFHKTARGKAGIETRCNGLSLLRRRVLIHLNGAELACLSLCANVAEIVRFLVDDGFIGDAIGTTSSVAARDYAGTK